MKTLAPAPDCDIAVVGGGVAGLCAALLCDAVGWRVCIVAPQQDATAPSGQIALRTYALTPAAARVLEHAGAWSRMDAVRLGHYTRMAVWDARSAGRIAFEPPPTHRTPMGYIVEHQALIAALIASIEQRRGIVWRHARLAGLPSAMPPVLALDDGSRLSARLVIGADGAHSQVRELAGIGHDETPYGQSALVTNIRTARPHEHVARQRFLVTGPLALLPLADAQACAVVWSLPEDTALHHAGVSPGALAVALHEASEGVLGDILEVSACATFPLARSSAQSYVSGSIALLGDAAHVVHPLAGQGLNLGLMDAAALIECVGTPGVRELWPAAAALRRYQRWRRSEALAMTLVTDGLHHLFRHDLAPLRLLRAAGMQATDRVEPLKAWLTARAMGLAGDLPVLARAPD